MTAGCKHTPLRSVASLLRKHCPRPTVLPFIRCTPVTTYFPPTSLYKLRWQPIFIPAQGSSYTIKTVGGEAVRRFFSLKYAVLSYTVSTLFTDPPLRQQKSFRKVFAELFPKSDRVPSRPLASPRVPCVLYAKRHQGWVVGMGTEKDIDFPLCGWGKERVCAKRATVATSDLGAP